MSHVDWEMQGLEITTCNWTTVAPASSTRCPRRRLPRHGGDAVDDGHFGDVKLDGTMWAGLFAWPKAIHEGNGEAAVIIDERATEAQRAALLTILSGGETSRARRSSTCSPAPSPRCTPLFRPIEFDGDLATARGRLTVPGIVEMTTSPIKNPVTGAEHRATVSLPARLRVHQRRVLLGPDQDRGEAPIAHDWDGRHAHLARLHLTPRGPVR